MSGHRLEGKIAIITGGASGIGAEAARLFAGHGARVVIVDVQDKLGRKVAVSIGEDRATYYRCDVTDEAQVENAVKFTVDKYGRLDILFSNAGIMEQFGSILDLNLAHLDRTMAVNLRGSTAFIKHAARAMVASGIRGSIVCTTSVAAEIAGAGPHAYTASKHALVGLVKSACGELGRHGIRVNGVAPFGVATGITSDGTAEGDKNVEGLIAASGNLKGVVLKTRDVAEAALFLASDESVYISGQNLVIDGGYSVVKQLPSA
ncbi:PREDICTED: short-chain dehydrogenase reductase 3b-like isoform X2 [Tarenaya hassleriana]|uniref:short-chain dehydrogenase reductase 3b-like isoform X1 n=1 Tax=Tarenaya hassleriana TaxID=28532 RepID=UPI00053C6EAC|nr:PREDICTED: short-chain dehydrogenase reductase 3b-like isoform X1 [Tarenaya hassleriana]XP_010523898.1 PREDICTED: short-chain dehydrogenase reductase 3b-like isoform X2 [Tarenaya hassleriana]